jgi:rhomboid protease GluP
MSPFDQKLKLIFLPYLLITAATIGIYSFLNWLLIIRFKLFVVDNVIVNVFIPVGFVFLNLVIWLLPRLRLLKLTFGYRKNPLFGLILLAGGAMVAPAFISQQYLNVITGKITMLDRVSQINDYPATRYYTIKHVYADKQLANVKYTAEVSNKSRDYDMSVYIAVPLLDNKPLHDTFKAQYTNQDALDPPTVKKEISPSAWLGFVYTKTVSNKITVAEKEEKFKAFAGDCQNDLDEAQINNFIYLNRLDYGFDQRELTAAIMKKNNKGSNIQNVFSPVYESFESRTGHQLFWIFGSFIIGAAIFLIVLQFFPLRDIVDIENYKF